MTSLSLKRLTPQQMIEDLPAFMLKIEQLAQRLGMDLSDYQADHIALRINDSEIAQQARIEWAKRGVEISQAEINGRPIIVSEFSSPLQTSHWAIECLELPFPAKGKLYPQEGWEHVEFVIPSQAETAESYLEDLTKRLPGLTATLSQLDELDIKMKLSSPKGEGERLNNPTVAFKHQGVCIKLHPHSLKAIVASEHA
ncbi:VOC family protein [Vibrio astriarenae]|uniref:VOC family protein n=1 Tax=Vibrio astriarenae TaxID=1481923 RepID=A0A7Z2T1V5_9VIBR|nr:VOC family protein [Vibrio astriarenae]QIA62844.1 VOC family protein [Vibrio astriarenae]